MTFRVGQEVVCIENLSSYARMGEITPKVGEIYTVRGFQNPGASSGLKLREIVNDARPYGDGFHECAFVVRAFRPIVKTDITIFEKMLAPAPKQRVKSDA